MSDTKRQLVLAGSIWGVLVAALISSIGFLNSSGPERGFTIPNVAFLVCFTAPFILALATLRFSNHRLRSALWFGLGVLVLLGSFVAFSGITLLFVPSAGCLLAASVKTWKEGPEQSMSIVRTMGLAVLVLGIVPVGAVSFLSLHASDDPRCWVLVNRDGDEVWESRPAGGGQSLSANVSRSTCTSDTTTTSEGVSSLLVWLIGGPVIAGLAFALDQRELRPQLAR